MVTADFYSLFKERRAPAYRILWVVFSVCIVVLGPARGMGQLSPVKKFPTVLMLSDSRTGAQDDELYTALRAQLSAAPMVLERLEAGDDTLPMTEERAARVASTSGAAMVFWIENEETCRLNFYVPDATGGRMTRRVVDLNLSSRSSRFDVIAVVASSVIEGLLVSKTLRIPKAGPPPNGTPSVVVRKDGVDVLRMRFEILAAYTGALVMENAVSHGIVLGVAALSRHRLAVQASFTQNLRQQFETESLRLDVLSRQLEVLAAGRLVKGPVDVRLGIAWSVDFRSYRTFASADTIVPRRDGLVTVHSLTPFVSAAWLFKNRFGLFARVGASLGLNEASYKLGIPPDGEIIVFEPFVAKLTYLFGLVIRL